MGNSNGRIGRFCDHAAGNREKVMVLGFHDSAPIQFELNYIEDKVLILLIPEEGDLPRVDKEFTK